MIVTCDIGCTCTCTSQVQWVDRIKYSNKYDYMYMYKCTCTCTSQVQWVDRIKYSNKYDYMYMYNCTCILSNNFLVQLLNDNIFYT